MAAAAPCAWRSSISSASKVESPGDSVIDESSDREVVTGGAPDGLIVTDAAGTVLSMNPAAERLSGWTASQARGRPFDEVFRVVAARTHAPLESLVACLLRGGQAVAHADARLIAKDGTERRVTASGATLRAESGEVTGVVAALCNRTEERRELEALRASDTRYRRLFEAARDGILILDAETGMVVDVNPFLTKLLGIAREQFLEKAIWDIGFFGDIAANREKFLELQRREYVRYENLPLEAADGRSVNVEFVSNVYLANDRRVIQCNIRDITGQRRAEEELVRLRRAVHASSDAIFMTDADGVFTFVNDGFTRLYGWSAAEVVGKRTPRILKSGETSRESSEALWRALLARQTVDREHVNVAKDGRRMTVEGTANAVADEDGRIVGFLGIQRDVTERKRVGEALRQSELLNRSLIDHLPQRVFLKDQSLKYVACNSRYADDVGTTPGQIAGTDDFAFHPKERAEAYRADDLLVMSSGLPRTLEERYFLGDAELWISTTKVPYHDDRGQVIGVLGIFEDVTERRQARETRELLEEQLRASQKMEAIGSLAGGIAHDFNNLLSVVLSYTAFAVDGLREGDPMRDDLLQVKEAGERAAALTKQLLAFGGRQILQPRPLDLNNVVEGIEKMLRRIIGEDIALQTVLAPDLGVTMADPGQMEQVLMNLIINARDAMPTGGLITIETGNVEIGEGLVARRGTVSPGPYVRLSITDTGSGMDEATRARIFEPFFTTKAAGRGTGLGLATVYGIVKQSGGAIWLYSELCAGTTFKIYLPRVPAAVAPAWSPPQVTRGEGTETILVAEDEAPVRDITKRILVAAGYTVLTAANGGEALLICEAHPGQIDLLLTDVVMPQLSGIVLAERLAQASPGMKVLYMSGYADSTIARYGAFGSAAHLIGKPFSAADLTRKVREVLDEEPRATPTDPPS